MQTRAWLFLGLIFLGSCQTKPVPGTWDWLVGKWVQTKTDSQVVEEWKKLNDSSYSGVSYVLKNTGEQQMLESVELQQRSGIWTYTPTTLGTGFPNPVTFRLVSHGTYGFTATNPQHDFPKRIVYERKGNDSLHAWIDGGESAPEPRLDFYYARSGN